MLVRASARSNTSSYQLLVLVAEERFTLARVVCLLCGRCGQSSCGSKVFGKHMAERGYGKIINIVSQPACLAGSARSPARQSAGWHSAAS